MRRGQHDLGCACHVTQRTGQLVVVVDPCGLELRAQVADLGCAVTQRLRYSWVASDGSLEVEPCHQIDARRS